MPDPTKLRVWLLPGAAERDEKFHQEVLRLSHLGWRLIGALAVGLPLVLLLARAPVIPAPSTRAAWLAPPLALMAAGAAALALASMHWSRRHARPLAAVTVVVLAAVLIASSAFGARQASSAERRLPGDLTLLTLLAVAAVPLRPGDALLLGLGIEGMNLAASAASGRFELVEHLFLVVLAAVAAALAAVAYGRRVKDYQERQRILRMSELLSTAQQRVLLSENAASLGRLANTLAHELNNPLGALASAVDTMMVIASKQATAPPAQQPRLLGLQAELRRSIHSSIERLQQTISRIRRLSGLDEAEFESVDLNELLKDMASLVATGFQGELKMEFDLEPLPKLTCQPQQLSAVFSNVISNAAKAMNGGGCVAITTRRQEGNAEIRVRDHGCGISEEQLADIFEPGFRSSQGRMGGGNWGLYSCRQIVHGHGGEIYITSVEGEGSTVIITLPL